MTSSAAIHMPPDFERTWPGAEALATEVVLNTVRCGHAFNVRVDAVARAHGLPSSTSVGLLEVLRQAGRPLQPSVLAQRGLITRPAASGVLDSLQKRRLVRRTAHPDSGRSILVEITPKGEDTLDRLLPALHRLEAQWLSVLTARQKADLVASLGIAQAALLEARDTVWPDAPDRPD